ncbi:hypothetical protein ABZ567_30280 [Streptomyces sp. NPDC016459]|uniref:hypothetical protein n=1 Tax=Streptomyces sp. NPDC016459 TaxID=3157190 RepID=UPI0033E77736
MGRPASALADLGITGLDDDPDDPVIITGRHRPEVIPSVPLRRTNKLISCERAASEHGFADVRNWRFLAKVRVNA